MTKPSPRKDGSRLMSDIIRSLESKPGQTADKLAAELGFGDSSIRTRLNLMLKDGTAIYKLAPGKETFSRAKLWELTGAPVADLGAELLPGFTERRISTKHYPLVDRRDPLVAALFGQAGSNP